MSDVSGSGSSSSSRPTPSATYIVKGKNVFLTGGGRGLGRSLVDALLTKGAKVVFCDINQDTGRATESEFRSKHGTDTVTFLPCDVKDDGQFKEVWRKTLEILGSVDVCVNNAAIVHETNFEECLLVNLGGTIRGSSLAYEHMRKDKGGRGGVILNVSSTGGISHNVCGIPAYGSTKHGIVGYTLSWASDPNTPARGVRWCTFCPRAIHTPIVHMTPDQVTMPFDQWTALVEGEERQSPEEMAQAFMELLEDADSNGHALCVYLDKGDIVYHTVANDSSDNPIMCSLVDVRRKVVPPYVAKP